MNLAEYSQRIVESSIEDWNLITCWGFSSGPSYLDRSSVWTDGKDRFLNLEIKSHSMVASFKHDLSISMAWGLQSNPDFKEEWANKFPDPQASSSFIDFFYQGVLIFRELYVSVDGARCRLPLPDREFDDQTNQVIRLTVPRDKHEFFQLFDSMESLSDFDNYFVRAGFEIVNTPWMV